MKKICIIAGPTAVGKSDVAVKIAKELCGEIISADSAQVYRYMDVGTAKIKPQEMDGIEHYMLNEVNPDEGFSVAEFQKRAENYIDIITQKGKLPIICGGTGLYINSLLNNLDFTKAMGDPDYRTKLQAIAMDKGNTYVYEMLRCVDEPSYKRLFPNDLKRVIRALEVYKITGKTITHFQEESKKIPPKYQYSYIGLGMDRSKLYERIDKRVDFMLEMGLLNEVKWLFEKGYDRNSNSMQALGYKEMASYLMGEIDYEEAVRVLKRDSRHFAKRQFTWFKNDARVHWLNTDSFFSKGDIYENIIRYTAGRLDNI